MIARFKNGRPATEHELDCIARGFGFNSLRDMTETFAAADARRDRKKAERARTAARLADRATKTANPAA